MKILFTNDLVLKDYGDQIMLKDIYTKEIYDNILNLAKTVVNTKFVPKEMRGNINETFAVMIYGLEIGIGPMQALQNIKVINDKPNIYGDLCLALICGHKDFEDIKEYFKDESQTVAVCEIKRKNRSWVVREFSINDAKTAGLQNRDHWQKYQKRMLQMRSRGFAMRDSFPDALKGLITREEAEDYEPVNGSTENNNENSELLPISDIKGFIQEVCDKYNFNCRLKDFINKKFGKDSLENLSYEECQIIYQKLIPAITQIKQLKQEENGQ